MTKYQLIIFDLDGTLINSISDIADIANKTLVKLGYPKHKEEEYKFFVGNGLKNLVIRCLPEEARNEENIERGFSSVLNEYIKNPINKTQLYAGIGDLLNELELLKIKKAILSNKADPVTQEIYKKLLSKWDFDLVIGSSEKFPSKPDPSSALFIAESLGVDVGNVLYVGDTSVDIQTAKAAGFTSVGVTWGFRPKKELIENGSDYIIDEPLDLLKFFN